MKRLPSSRCSVVLICSSHRVVATSPDHQSGSAAIASGMAWAILSPWMELWSHLKVDRPERSLHTDDDEDLVCHQIDGNRPGSCLVEQSTRGHNRDHRPISSSDASDSLPRAVSSPEQILELGDPVVPVPSRKVPSSSRSSCLEKLGNHLMPPKVSSVHVIKA